MNILFWIYWIVWIAKKIKKSNKNKKMKTAKVRSWTPNTNLGIQKELARLKYIFEQKNKYDYYYYYYYYYYVWLSFWELIFFVFEFKKKTKKMKAPKVRSWTPNTNLCIQKNLNTKLYIWNKDSNA